MSNSKNALAINTVIAVIDIVIGLCGVFFFSLCTVFSVIDESEPDISTLITFLIFVYLTAAGVMLIFRGIKRKELQKTFTTYNRILMRDPNRSLVNLSNATNVPLHTINKNVMLMIKRNFWGEVHYDAVNNRLIFPLDTANMHMNAGYGQIISASGTVTCNYCGEVNYVSRDQNAKCTFCGTALR